MPSLPTLPPDPSVVCPPCTKCCRYVAVSIEPPGTVARVSTTLWLLYHARTSVYQSHEGDWFLLVPGDCENLLPDGLCGVYESRPLICRDYSVDGCEGTSAEAPERVRFDDARQLLDWVRERRPRLYQKCRDAGILPAKYLEDAVSPRPGGTGDGASETVRPGGPGDGASGAAARLRPGGPGDGASGAAARLRPGGPGDGATVPHARLPVRRPR